MLSDILRLDKYKNIALVGAGGKTTLIYRLLDNIRPNRKILVSSTTMFKEPHESRYDFIDYSYKEDYSFDAMSGNGIYIVCNGRTPDNFLIGLGRDEVARLSSNFDNSVIECDYSMGRPLKGFRLSEAGVPESTDVTVGVLDIEALGLEVKSDNVFHLDRFIEVTGSRIYSMVTLENLKSIVDNPEGLFLGASGKKVLFINKVEKHIDFELMKRLVDIIDKDRLDMVIAGSLFYDRYNILYGGI
ncbi:selenium cofactor biosynthesis protein YqeC [Youngiibacter multivorans]|uniref:Selenium-dependent hydroxylase accessory protein YqeC n=1 Tax=Youngiibacter multivorans TaxID=937251 RepID=A0ABS4G4P3_9CLOT|nr:putative selenium-dependent hydroxylase accessory protein YqeC [Youngiibacter multivorans]